MKKVFTFSHPKIKVDRLFEAARKDIKKYIKRERGKELPEGADFWDFDCRFGATEQEAKVIHLNDIGKNITEIQEKSLESFYLEILAKPASRSKKPRVAEPAQVELPKE